MTTKPEDVEPLELTPDLEVEPDEQPQEPSEEQPENPEVNDEGEEETVVSFGDDAEQQPDDSSTIRHLREKLREKDTRIKELETASPPKKVERKPEPTLEGCDYDEEKFKAEWKAWNAEESKVADQQREAAEREKAVNAEWENDFSTYQQKKTALPFADKDDVTDTVAASLDLVQQAVIVKSADDPALFTYAIGKSPTKLAELAKIKDPIKFAAAVVRMEGAIKVTTKRKAPEPDRPLSGSGAVPKGDDKELERLEREADRTNDRSRVIAYKRKLKEKARQ